MQWMKSPAYRLACSDRSKPLRRPRIVKKRPRRPKRAPRNGSQIRVRYSSYVPSEKPSHHPSPGRRDHPGLRPDRCQSDIPEAPEDIARFYAEGSEPDAGIDLRFQAHAAADEFRGTDGPSRAVAVGLCLAILRSGTEACPARIDEQEGRC